MEVKEAVKIAIDYVADVFSSENLSNIGLEEIVFKDSTNKWEVTVGFSRPWDYQSSGFSTGILSKQPDRHYKVVEVDDVNGDIKAIKIRE